MSNSNPQLKQYIRENLMNMYLELQEASKARKALYRAGKAKAGNFGGEGDVNATESGGRSDTPSRFGDTFAKRNFRRDQKSTPGTTVSSPAMIKAQTKNAITSARGKDMLGRVAAKMGDQNAATMADNTALAGENAALTAAAQATPMGKWKMGIANTDSKLFGNAAQGEVAATKGLMGSGGKIGMGAKLGGVGIGAVMQGLSSASTEYAENLDKGMSTGENVAKTVGRGVAGAAGAGLGTWGGAAAGAAIGSVVPVVGTAIGAVLGGIVGGMGGGYLADKAADMVTNIGDNPETIKDFQADREIKDIQRKDKVQAERQRLADEKFTKGKPADGKSSDTTTGSPMTPAPAGVDYNSTDDSDDQDQEQDFSFNSRPNQGNDVGAAGGQINVRMRQRQRQ